LLEALKLVTNKMIESVASDIARREQAEEEKKKLRIQLQRAEKMEVVGTLAGGVAHDLNNILCGLVSYPDFMLMDLPMDSPLREPLLTIRNSGQKAAAIVQDLLTLFPPCTITERIFHHACNPEIGENAGTVVDGKAAVGIPRNPRQMHGVCAHICAGLQGADHGLFPFRRSDKPIPANEHKRLIQ
jgi:hypothetical protein